jgi:hypothetical protein
MKWLATIIHEVIPPVGERAQLGKIFEKPLMALVLGLSASSMNSYGGRKIWIHIRDEEYEFIWLRWLHKEYEFILHTYEFICHHLPTTNSYNWRRVRIHIQFTCEWIIWIHRICCKPSDQPRDAARREKCSDLDEKSVTTFCRCDRRAKGIC